MYLDDIKVTFSENNISKDATKIKRNSSAPNLKKNEIEFLSDIKENKNMKKWRVMLNVMKAIKNLKTFSTQDIESVREIDNYFNWSKTKHFKQAFTTNDRIMLDYLIKNKSKIEKSDKKNDDENLANAHLDLKQSNSDLIQNTIINRNVKLENQGNIEKTANNDKIVKKTINNHILENEVIHEKNEELISLPDDPNELDVSFESRNSYESEKPFHRNENTLNDIITEYSKISQCEDFVTQGDEVNLGKLKQILMSDPKRNMFGKSERDRYFVNQTTPEGLTFIYMACLNGHVKYVDLLLDCDANHLIKCGKDQFSILDVAVKWNHTKLISYLLFESKFKLEWPKEYLYNSLKISNKLNNKHTSVLIKKKLQEIDTGCCLACT